MAAAVFASAAGGDPGGLRPQGLGLGFRDLLDGPEVPDTDTVAAAMVYAWELTSRNISAEAFRLGELNPETDYVLQAAKLAWDPTSSALRQPQKSL